MNADVRRRRLCAAGAAALFGLGPGVRTVRANPRQSLSISVGGKAEMYFLPLTVAEQLGYFREHGLDVRIDDHPGGSQALQAALAGTSDVVCGAYEHTIVLQAQGQVFQCLALMGRAPQVAVGVSTRSLPNYRGAMELRGRRVGITARASTTHRVVSLLLERAGMRAYDVEFVETDHPHTAMRLLRDGEIDAISHFDPLITELEQRLAIKLVADTRTMRGTVEVFGGPMPAACLYAPADFVAKRSEACQALADAVTRALRWLQTAGARDIIRTVPDAYLLGDRALYLAAFNNIRESFAVDGVLPPASAQTALKMAVRFDKAIDAQRIDLRKTYDNRYAEAARKRYGA